MDVLHHQWFFEAPLPCKPAEYVFIIGWLVGIGLLVLVPVLVHAHIHVHVHVHVHLHGHVHVHVHVAVHGHVLTLFLLSPLQYSPQLPHERVFDAQLAHDRPPPAAPPRHPRAKWREQRRARTASANHAAVSRA